MNEFEQLKQELADSAAISDIESMLGGFDVFGQRWYDSESADAADREDVLRALKYLAYRNLIERHTDNRYWVGIRR